jgi:hypothetical protein
LPYNIENMTHIQRRRRSCGGRRERPAHQGTQPRAAPLRDLGIQIPNDAKGTISVALVMDGPAL